MSPTRLQDNAASLAFKMPIRGLIALRVSLEYFRRDDSLVGLEVLLYTTSKIVHAMDMDCSTASNATGPVARSKSQTLPLRASTSKPALLQVRTLESEGSRIRRDISRYSSKPSLSA